MRRGEQESGDAILNDCAVSRDFANEHGHLQRHCFEQRLRHPFTERRVDDDEAARDERESLRVRHRTCVRDAFGVRCDVTQEGSCEGLVELQQKR